MRRTYSARQLGQAASCTRAQLDYYRDIGLLTPGCDLHGADRYDDVNLLRLKQIRMGRAAGLALEEIRRWLEQGDAAPDLARAHSPRADDHSPPRCPLYVEVEAKVETEGERRAFEAEGDDLYRSLATYLRASAHPTDPRLELWVERHRNYIERWFCPCAPCTHLAFARAIVKNPLLAASIDRQGSRDLRAFVVAVVRQQTSQAGSE